MYQLVEAEPEQAEAAVAAAILLTLPRVGRAAAIPCRTDCPPYPASAQAGGLAVQLDAGTIRLMFAQFCAFGP